MYTRNFHRKLGKKTMGEGENIFLKRGGVTRRNERKRLQRSILKKTSYSHTYKK